MITLSIKRLRHVLAVADRNPGEDVKLTHEEVEAIRSVLRELDETKQREEINAMYAMPGAYLR